MAPGIGIALRHTTRGLVFFLTCFLLSGCHSTTVSVVAEDPSDPPQLVVQIADHQAGEVEIHNTQEKDWLLGTRHNKTFIHVPPGSKIIVMPASGPMIRYPVATEPATEPASEPDDRPDFGEDK